MAEAGLSQATPAENAFLLAARVGRLATVDAELCPHAVPICFAVAGGCIYSPLDEKPKTVAPRQLRRVQNVLRNPAVCLVVDRYSENWEELAWLQVRAHADLLESAHSEHARAVAALRLRYPQYRRMALEDRPMLRLTPDRVVSWGISV